MNMVAHFSVLSPHCATCPVMIFVGCSLLRQHQRAQLQHAHTRFKLHTEKTPVDDQTVRDHYFLDGILVVVRHEEVL